jgi:hypothetical protein
MDLTMKTIRFIFGFWLAMVFLLLCFGLGALMGLVIPS